ncbi:helix-turn-helix transcriptional regulator [Endozoicomonas numazuensis]|uniref:HTH araC/xylS-type domain-containing protein n=1 Tax=Endozoicomonas numazuensis TaxID=1137799 RepID=A0A081N6H1_9GAMM|nr:helix-turn-helix transcriptional regulator [Endozoicomonas numazuensis]KEQ14044.1 hypothetical protein GZ78_25740 [Endozoicomonas numazuensis]
MEDLIRIHHYRGTQPQRLRNVSIYTPSIFSVMTGHKVLKWHQDNLSFHQKNWLITSSNESLTFVNEPTRNPFHSMQIAFLEPPDEHLINATAPSRKALGKTPDFSPSPSLLMLWQQLQSITATPYSKAVQRHILQAFYQQLWEEGGLPLLFPDTGMTTRERLARHLSNNPAGPHSLESCSRSLGVSKATLARHLTREATSFRDILAEVRMTYSLNLMQQRTYSQLDLALQCGYQSESRFSQRFRQQFGITPRQYMKTLI